MREFSNCAHFHDLIEVDGYIYYSESTFNGLFRYKTDDTHAEYLGVFHNEDIWQWDLHRRIVKYGDGLFFIPLNGRGISIYQPSKSQFDYIEICKENEKNVHFSDTIMIDDDNVLLVPQWDSDLFMILDLGNKSVERVGWLSNKLKTRIKNNVHSEWAPFSTQSYCMINTNIYIALSDSNYLYKLDLNMKEIEEIKLPCNEHIRGIFGIDESIWISFRENIVARYDVLSGNLEIKEIPYDTDNTTYPYLLVLEHSNRVVIIPGREDKFIATNREMNTWEIIGFPANYKREFGIGNSVLTLGYKIVGTKLYMYPRSSNGILIYDFSSNSLDSISVTYETEFVESLRGRFATTYFARNIIYESDDYGIDEFMMGLVSKA